MKHIRTGLIALAALAATLGAAEVTAQANAVDGRRGMRAMRGGGMGVERIMSARERLELSDGQIAQLDEIRQATVSRRAAEQAEMAEMRSQLQAGQIRQSAMMAYMEERRDAAPAVRTDVQEQIEGILTEAQRESLAEFQGQRRGFVRGQATARARPGRAFRQGNRGDDRRGPPMNRGIRGRG